MGAGAREEQSRVREHEIQFVSEMEKMRAQLAEKDRQIAEPSTSSTISNLNS